MKRFVRERHNYNAICIVEGAFINGIEKKRQFLQFEIFEGCFLSGKQFIPKYHKHIESKNI